MNMGMIACFSLGGCHVTVLFWCFEQQSFFVMSVFTVVMLTPAAWILHHLPEYRQRSRQNPKT